MCQQVLQLYSLFYCSSKEVITFNLLIIASSESMDIDKPCISRFANILA